MTKLRVHKVHVVQSINWYQEKLCESFGSNYAVSEAHREIMRRELRALQSGMARKERTNSWLIPVSLNFAVDGTFQVGLIDESQLLYLDDPVVPTTTTEV